MPCDNECKACISSSFDGQLVYASLFYMTYCVMFGLKWRKSSERWYIYPGLATEIYITF